MATPNIDSKPIVNAAYHGAVVAGLTIGCAKLTRMVFKKAVPPKLDADFYDAGMLMLDVTAAMFIRDFLVKQGIIPPDILK